ncbi:MAG: histidinol-phosphatase [Planctomycetia bacterium]|nr:histidinol-phosphatase [Planctomycetia bacterium]
MREENIEPIFNLHTHTHLCKHASGKVVDYCQIAADNGLELLGISDHCPLPEQNQFCDTRMDPEELDVYKAELNEAKICFPQLKILTGMELDYFPKYGLDYYWDLKKQCELDYFIGGVHYVFNQKGDLLWRRRGENSKELVNNYIRQAVEMMETGLLDYLTHPDLIGSSIDEWTPWVNDAFRELVKTAIKLDIPLEVNAYGIRKGIIQTAGGPRWRYPVPSFWKMAAEYEPRTVIGADAHSPETLLEEWTTCRTLLQEVGLTPCNKEIAEKILKRKDPRKK